MTFNSRHRAVSVTLPAGHAIYRLRFQSSICFNVPSVSDSGADTAIAVVLSSGKVRKDFGRIAIFPRRVTVMTLPVRLRLRRTDLLDHIAIPDF